MSPFDLWGFEHCLVIVLTFAAPVVVGFWTRKDRSERRARFIAAGIALVLLAQVVANLLLVGLAEKQGWAEFMPLHLCHLALFACVGACLWRNRLAYEISYFWGLSGTLQGVLTPGLEQAFPSKEFILFFLGHSGIVGTVIFLTVAFRQRPERRSILRAYGGILLYAAVAGGFNALFGTNYGFLRAKPTVATLFDWLGPWPWYIASAAVIAFIFFCLLYLPWEIADRTRSARKLQQPRTKLQ